MGDNFAKTMGTIGEVASGVNNAVTAGVAIKNAFSTPKTKASPISLTSSGGGSLGGTQAFSPANLASGFKVDGYNTGSPGGGGGGGGGAPQSGELSRQHYSNLMDILKIPRG